MRGHFLKVMGGVLLLAATVGVVERTSEAQDVKSKSGVPVFQLDASWPKMPEKLKWGPLFGMAVDSHDNAWMIQRRGIATEKEQAGSPVVEFDAAGNYIQGWGGPGQGYEWPAGSEHTIFVDDNDNVWITGANQILKFTKTGKFLLQIGHGGKGNGSNDVENLGGTDAVYVDLKTNEVFVASNRRVIVLDATTGAFKRYWGAYGNRPNDTVGDVQQFADVHSVRLSNDRQVYVTAMHQGRIQSFTVDGKFQKELVIDRDTNNLSSIAFSPDPQQQFMYVADYRKVLVRILNRQTLEEIGSIGQAGEMKGTQPNGVYGPHMIATDSKGNLYLVELGDRTGDRPATFVGRAQKYLFKGISKP